MTNINTNTTQNTTNQKPLIILLTTRQVLTPLMSSDKKLSPRLMYKLIKFINQSNEEEQFYTERLRAIFDEYALKKEDGSFEETEDKTGIKLIPEKSQDFQKAMYELDITEVNVPNITFTLDELESIGLNEVSGREMAALMEFMEGE